MNTMMGDTINRCYDCHSPNCHQLALNGGNSRKGKKKIIQFQRSYPKRIIIPLFCLHSTWVQNMKTWFTEQSSLNVPSCDTLEMFVVCCWRLSASHCIVRTRKAMMIINIVWEPRHRRGNIRLTVGNIAGVTIFGVLAWSCLTSIILHQTEVSK